MKNKIHINAQLLYVIAIAWLVAAVGCIIRHVGVLAVVFAAMGTLHFIAAIVADVKESKK